jgi:hypothetical protein
MYILIVICRITFETSCLLADCQTSLVGHAPTVKKQCYKQFQNGNVLLESAQTRSKKICWLNLLNFGHHLLQNSLLGNMEVIFPNAVEYRLQFPLNMRHCFIKSSFQFHFSFGKQREITGG